MVNTVSALYDKYGRDLSYKNRGLLTSYYEVDFDNKHLFLGETDSIEHCIDSGSFGSIWQVIDPRNKRYVALKKVSNIFDSLQRVTMAFRELTILSNIHHDNVLNLRDVVIPSVKDHFCEMYLITEMMLASLCDHLDSGPVRMEKTKLFMYQIMHGVKYIHDSEIIHGDLKCENILMGHNNQLKICDFGFARKEGSEDFSTYGTIQFLAPEVLMGSRECDKSLDIWSVGCIMAELLSGDILFDEDTEMDMLFQICRVLGTPSTKVLARAKPEISEALKKRPHYSFSTDSLMYLSDEMTEKDAQLLENLLHLDCKLRYTADVALKSDFFVHGREKFHQEICTCCEHDEGCVVGVFPLELDEHDTFEIDSSWEEDLLEQSEEEIRKILFEKISSIAHGYLKIPLKLNTESEKWTELVDYNTNKLYESRTNSYEPVTKKQCRT
uniref:Protein kinase domain-containing protein n=1 Tax=Rhabditophanes sp. KR3021 TaxID=114890 RepID=A0AC35U3I1_9BILA